MKFMTCLWMATDAALYQQVSRAQSPTPVSLRK
jgi:hypothetical protein